MSERTQVFLNLMNNGFDVGSYSRFNLTYEEDFSSYPIILIRDNYVTTSNEYFLDITVQELTLVEVMNLRVSISGLVIKNEPKKRNFGSIILKFE